MGGIGTLTTGRGNLRRLLAAGAATLAVAGLLGPLAPAAAGAAATGTWSVQASPDATAPQGQFAGVSCVSATACMAVGSAASASRGQVALAERWNGTSWTVLAVPRPAGAASYALSAVSCTSASACTAVGFARPRSGFDRPLAERWNGTTWAVQATIQRDEGSYLLGVSCASASACTAVGFSREVPNLLALAERWNGTKWVIQRSANATSYNSLSAVSCPSVTLCVAVGTTNPGGTRTHTVAERWNGTKWAVQSTPNPEGSSTLTGVSCTSGAACTAVGHSGIPGSTRVLAERWNGATWAVQRAPNPSGADFLLGVSCTSNSACIAVGYGNGGQGFTPGGVLAEAWNGTKWSVQTTPYHGQFPQLNAVSCPSAAACSAVGANTTGTGVTLAEAWNGEDWAIQPSPTPLGAEASWLTGISCASASACMAVGNYTNHPDAYGGGALAERWNGRRWATEPTPRVPGAIRGYESRSGLSGVSCTSASACTAVGFYMTGPGTGYEAGLAERWNGKTWAVQSLPTSAEFSPLTDVSCGSATSCVAVGQYFKLTHPTPYKALVERWNGKTWATEAVSSPSGSAGLAAVSCTSATACTLVGGYTVGDNEYTLAERWNGTKWTIQSTPNAAGSTESWLTGVSCTSATACIAVGSASGTKTGSIDVPLAERWNGTKWAILPTPNPSGPVNELYGVSCTSATMCTAVGKMTNKTLAVQWNGKTWAIETTPNQGDSSNELSAVSCQAAGPCTAAGNYYSASGYNALVERRS